MRCFRRFVNANLVWSHRNGHNIPSDVGYVIWSQVTRVRCCKTHKHTTDGRTHNEIIIGTCTRPERPTQGYHFEWPWMTLSDLEWLSEIFNDANHRGLSVTSIELPFSFAVTVTIANTHCAYAGMVGQAESASVAGFVGIVYLHSKVGHIPIPIPLQKSSKNRHK